MRVTKNLSKKRLAIRLEGGSECVQIFDSRLVGEWVNERCEP